MKKLNILLFGLVLLGLSSCDKYLDKLPDDRAEINTYEKARQLLISAYATSSPDFLLEMSSDNVADNGRVYTAQPDQNQAYRWQEVTTTGNDDPRSVWNNTYEAVGTANIVLDALKNIHDADTKALHAEALLCRAWAIFRLSNAFCMAYDSTKAASYLGLPYPTAPNVSVNERGTLEQLYANINADIESALPDVDDTHLKVPKYHFNRRAAYAFAARFNLYYHNYDKAIAYATQALGSQPAGLLRNVARYATLAGVNDIANAYINSGENANFMLQDAISNTGILYHSRFYQRYLHNVMLAKSETLWVQAPWNPSIGTRNNTLYEANLLYGNNQALFYPKLVYKMEYLDKESGTGYFHIVDAVFTADETLLVRAEAEALKGDFKAALADMNTWIQAHCQENYGAGVRPTFTEASLNVYMNSMPEVPAIITKDSDRGYKKPLHPQGFTVATGTMTNLIYMILQMRRIETLYQGLRFQDVKRYGIQICHVIEGESTLKFKSGDLRGALQLPADVVAAGLVPNPR